MSTLISTQSSIEIKFVQMKRMNICWFVLVPVSRASLQYRFENATNCIIYALLFATIYLQFGFSVVGCVYLCLYTYQRRAFYYTDHNSITIIEQGMRTLIYQICAANRIKERQRKRIGNACFGADVP